jgi:F-type H+-transporting ATPase subunit a
MPLSPRSWAIAILAAILDTTRAVTGSEPNTLGWLPVVTTLIVVVGGTNLLANIPGGYCLSTSLAVAGSLSLAVWLWVFLESLLLQGSRFWASFIPSGTPLLLVPVLVPIEILSFSARAFSLGVRLFSNVLAGHTLLAILAGFLLGGLSSGWIAGLVSLAFLGLYTSLVFLEVAVSLIQAYVFSVLTVSYLAGAL